MEMTIWKGVFLWVLRLPAKIEKVLQGKQLAVIRSAAEELNKMEASNNV